MNKNNIDKVLVFYPLILLLYKDPGSGIRKALFSRIPDPIKKAKDPADPQHWLLRVYNNVKFILRAKILLMHPKYEINFDASLSVNYSKMSITIIGISLLLLI